MHASPPAGIHIMYLSFQVSRFGAHTEKIQKKIQNLKNLKFKAYNCLLHYVATMSMPSLTVHDHVSHLKHVIGDPRVMKTLHLQVLV
jgi:hypothetical protein